MIHCLGLLLQIILITISIITTNGNVAELGPQYSGIAPLFEGSDISALFPGTVEAEAEAAEALHGDSCGGDIILPEEWEEFGESIFDKR